MKFKNLIKRAKNKFISGQRRRQKELDRDLDYLDSDFFYFLKLIFIKKEIDKNTLIKKRRLTEEKFNFFKDLGISNNYLTYSLVSKKKGGELYSMTNEGIVFLMKYKKLQTEENQSNVIKWATIVLALSAFVQVIDIWVNKPTTKNSILQLIINIFTSFIEFIRGIIPIIIIILIIYILVKINKKIKKRKL